MQAYLRRKWLISRTRECVDTAALALTLLESVDVPFGDTFAKFSALLLPFRLMNQGARAACAGHAVRQCRPRRQPVPQVAA